MTKKLQPLADTPVKVLVALGVSKREADKQAEKLKDGQALVTCYQAVMAATADLRKLLRSKDTKTDAVQKAGLVLQEKRAELAKALEQKAEPKQQAKAPGEQKPKPD